MRGDATPHSFDNTLIFVALALHVSTGFASTQREYYGKQVPGWPPTRTVFLSDTTRYLNVTRREKFDQSQPGRQQRAGLCFGVFDGGFGRCPPWLASPGNAPRVHEPLFIHCCKAGFSAPSCVLAHLCFAEQGCSSWASQAASSTHRTHIDGLTKSVSEIDRARRSLRGWLPCFG